MPHFQSKDLQKIAGIATQNVKKDEDFLLWTKGFMSSDEAGFSKVATNIISEVFNKLGILEESVIRYLYIQHSDSSSDLWINDFNVIVEARVKRQVLSGEFLYSNNIADVRRLKFPDIVIKDDDNVVYCFKHGWKFNIYVDFTRSSQPKSDDDLYLSLGLVYKKAVFKYLFDLFSKDNLSYDVFKNGWFPYIEIIGNEYEQLLYAYNSQFAIDEKTESIVQTFDKSRIEKIVHKWWLNTTFLNKKKILQTGIQNLISNTDEGNIAAIKIFYTEAEGLIRQEYFSEIKKDPRRQTNILWEYLKNKAKIKAGCESSLFFETKFSEFLQTHIYKHFNLANGEIDLSRHTVSHGVANSQEYSREKAIQGLLILDQLFFYLS